ncbi:MAG: hypothetical protein V7696_08900 [Halioglobus sp.]
MLFDDWSVVESNPRIAIADGHFDSWRIALASSEAGDFGRPIAMFSFALNQLVFGPDNVFALKVVNVVIHCVVGLVIFVLSRLVLAALFPSRKQSQIELAALISCLVWLLHPLHVSTVLYTVQRMAQLSTLFVLLGLVAYVRQRVQWARTGASLPEIMNTLSWLLLVTVLATLCKENGVLLPLLALVVEVAVFRGMWAGRENTRLRYLLIAVLAVPFIIAATWLFFPPDFVLAGYAGREFSLESRLLTQSRLLWHYLGWLSFPAPSHMGFHHDDILISRSFWEPMGTWISIGAWLLVLLGSVACQRRCPVLLFALLFFVVAHSLESGFFALEMVFEHRNYLPSVGICILLASLILIPSSSGISVDSRLLVLGPTMILLSLLVLRTTAWSDGITLSGTNVRNHPNSVRANYWYGHWLLRDAESQQVSHPEAEDLKGKIIEARSYLISAHNLKSNDMAVLYLLHYIDGRYFSAAPERPDWLGIMASSANNHILSSSDVNALVALVGCTVDKHCVSEDRKLGVIIDSARNSHPRSLPLLAAHYQLKSAEKQPLEQLESIAKRGLVIDPTDLFFTARSFELLHVKGDVAGMYRVLGAWISSDLTRRDLAMIKSKFGDN